MWINVNTGGTFTLHADIRFECWKAGIQLPGVLTDAAIAEHGYMPVTQVKPDFDENTHGISPLPCVCVDGKWEQHFEVYALDPAIVANNLALLAVHERAKWESVSPRQIRQALTRAGLRAQVEAAVAAGDQDLKDWWEFATAVERPNQHVVAMGAALGQTETQLDDLFKLAASL